MMCRRGEGERGEKKEKKHMVCEKGGKADRCY